MTTKQSKEKIDCSQQIWDTYPHKLLLFIMSARDVAAKDSNGKSDPYVVIEHGKYKKQTKVVEKTLQPVWNELFFIQADPTIHIKLEMWDHDKIGSHDFMGYVTLDLKTIPQDRIVDISPPLLARKKKESVSGSIFVRVYHSSARETRPPTHAPPDPASPQFLYRPFKSAFKPGDLIGFGGYGIISGIQKVLSANPITSVGMVVYLPNKWTGETEPYIIEMTRNINKNIDVFSETNNKSGIYIFHLFERFHQFNGSDLLHFPLLYPLPADMYKKIVEKIWEFHKKNAYLDESRENYKYGPYLPALNTFIRKKKNWIFAKNERLVEAASFDFVCRLYKESGAHTTDYQDPSDILKSNIFAPPILIRQNQGDAPLYFHNYLVPVPATATAPQVHLPSYSSIPAYTRTMSSLRFSSTSLPSMSSSPPSSIQFSSSPPSSLHPASANARERSSSRGASPVPALSANVARERGASPARSPRNPTAGLSQLEMDMLAGLLDGVVMDGGQLTVTKDEFRQKLVSKGITLFKDEAKFTAFYNLLDSDNDGRVDLRELVCGLAIFVDGSIDQKLLSAFNVFDRDGDKFIIKAELRTLLSTMVKAANKNASEQANSVVVEDFVKQIFAEYDQNGDGRLSLDEFLNAAHSNSAVGNLFLTVSSFV